MNLTQLLEAYDVSEDEFVAHLSRTLQEMPNLTASRLAPADESFLLEQGGVATTLGNVQMVQQTALRSAASNLAQQARDSLSVEQAAALLGVNASRVRRRVRDRALYAFTISARLRLPTWQFDGDDPIPGLRAVLAVLPADLHPLEVAGFMTTPEPDLAVGDEAMSPRDWLVNGGSVGRVVDLASQFDVW